MQLGRQTKNLAGHSKPWRTTCISNNNHKQQNIIDWIIPRQVTRGSGNLTTLENVKKRAENDAKTHGYYLTPDPELLQDLLEGLQKNEERYGYPSCPCRLASGKFELDRDIICPCDYRDPDVDEYGQCYCALYVRKDVIEGKTATQPIPERRPMEKQARAYTISSESTAKTPPQNVEQTEKAP